MVEDIYTACARYTRHHYKNLPVASPFLPRQLGEPSDTVAIFLAVGATIRGSSLPIDLFEDLLRPFRPDMGMKRYNTWAELLE